MQENTRALFSPVGFGSIVARNRVVMAPAVTCLANHDDTVSRRQLSYYSVRARGGVGTVVVESSLVCKGARSSRWRIGCYHDRFIPGLARLAEAIKVEGAVAILQLNHSGAKSLKTPAPSISEVAVREGIVPRALSVAELRQARRQFVDAAQRALKAGFDGVEIHAGHLYLLSAALSPFTNTRRDAYGGSLANRARLARETIEDTKAAVGSGLVTWVRIHGCEKLEPGLRVEECQQIASILERAGADAIDVSSYSIPINPAIANMMRYRFASVPLKSTPPGPFLPYAAEIKRAVRVPVIAVGKLSDPELAGRSLVEGKCDMVALARQLICDPYWPKKVEEGRTSEVAWCDYCMTCHTSQRNSQHIRCSKNLNLCGEPRYRRNRCA